MARRPKKDPWVSHPPEVLNPRFSTHSLSSWCSPVRSGRTVRRGIDDRSWFGGRPQAIRKGGRECRHKRGRTRRMCWRPSGTTLFRQSEVRGCRKRFLRKDPGVSDLLGSSLSCDTTGLVLPNKHLCLWVAEPLNPPQQHPKRVSSKFPSLLFQGPPRLLHGVLPQITTLFKRRLFPLSICMAWLAAVSKQN